jgi:hypothetical protein
MMHKQNVWVDPNTLMVSAGIPSHCVSLAEHYNVIAAEISERGDLTDELLNEITKAGTALIKALQAKV